MPNSNFNILSHLTALRAFEAAARHESFQMAARELNVTNGAVSRALRQLETATGVRLFERLHRSVRLTDKGAELASQITPAFDQLRRAQRSFADAPVSEDLVIAAPDTFQLRWLVPRQRGLQAAVGNRQIYTTTWDKAPEPNFDIVTMFIGIGQPAPADGCEIIDLMPESFAMVVSPKALRPGESMEECIARLPRLIPGSRPNIWYDWITEGGINPPHQGVQHYERLFLSLQAAEAGIGTTIAPVEIIQDSLENGLLTMPYGSVRRDGCYHMVIPVRRMHEGYLKSAVRWFQNEARATVASL